MTLAWILGLCGTNEFTAGLRYSPVLGDGRNVTLVPAQRLAERRDLRRRQRAGQVVESSLVILDLARFWAWPVGCGTESEPESSLEQSPAKREAAFCKLYRTNKRAPELQ